MIRDQIKSDLIKVIRKFCGSDVGEIEIARSDNPDHGDYTSNVAMVFARKVKQSPMAFAKDLADRLKSQAYIEKLEVKGPGFLNFFIKSEILQNEIEKVLKADKFESSFSGQKVIVEFTDPNPFKEFHVGHLYSNSVGEAISRLLEVVGAQVKRANYQGDVGLHVAKCIWGIRKKMKSPAFAKASVGRQRVKGKSWQDLKSANLIEKIDFLGLCYAAGAEAYETDEKAKKEIIETNREVYEKLDAIEEYKLGKEWSLENFEAIYARLGTKFDLAYFESEVGVEGAQIVNKNVGKVFEKSDGAVIFPGEKYGLHNRVFINSLGLPTYEAKELGLAFRKFADFAYDKSIIVTGSEIVDYFKVLVKALELIDPELASKTTHIAHGMVRMPGGKISSRLGNVISATDLLKEAKKRAIALAKDKQKSKTPANDQIAEQVAVGAIKYAMLRGNVGQDIKFSYDEAMSLEGNSGPYLQYTYARCRSVLEKATTRHSEPFDVIASEAKQSQDKLREESQNRSFVFQTQDDNKEELHLLRALGHFEEVVVDAAQAFAPNQVASFLFEVAQKYNNLYNNLRIIDAREPDRSRRLFLTEATADILGKGLNLLGIATPEKM